MMCECGHEWGDHYQYIRNGVDTWACSGCDPLNMPRFREAAWDKTMGQNFMAVSNDSYVAEMMEAMNHEFKAVSRLTFEDV